MKWRTPHVLLEVLAATIVAILVFGAVAFWRLSQGPVSISFLTPYVTQMLADIPSVKIDVRDTILTWSGWERPVDIRAVGVTATASDGHLIASVPELSVRLSVTALLGGEFEPTRLEVYEPVVQLVRTEAGDFEIGIGQEEGQSADQFGMFSDVLLQPLKRDGPLGRLRRVSIIDGSLRVEDRGLGISWGSPKTFVRLERGADRVDLQFDLQTDLGDQIPHIRGSGRYFPARKEIEIEGDVRGFWPARLAAKAPAFRRLAPIDLPLDLSIRVGLDSDRSIKTGEIELTGGAGLITMPDVLPKTVKVRSVKGRGTLKQFPDRFVLETFDIDIGGPRLNARAVMTLVDKVAAINGEVVARDLPVAALRDYWPKGASPGGLAWVSKNMTKGLIREARTSLIAHANTETESVEIDSVTGRLKTEGMTIHYLRPLPPTTGVFATGRFGADFLTFDIQRGSASGIDVAGGTVKLLGLGSKNERLDVQVALNGPLRNALELLDHPRFGYAKELGIEPSVVTGGAATRLSVGLPLLDKLPFSKVAIRAESDLTAVAIPSMMLGGGIADGNMSLKLDNKAMTLSGRASVAGVPSDISLTRNFQDVDAFLTRATLKASVQPEHHKALDIALDPYVTGPIGVEVELIERVSKTTEISGKLDLQAASLAVPEMGWSKPAGGAGAGSFLIKVGPTQRTRLEKFNLDAGALQVRGNADLAKDRPSGIRRLEVQRFKLGETDLRATFRESERGARQVALEGPTLDARPFLDLKESLQGKENGATTRSSPYDMTARIGEVIVGADRSLRNVSASGRHDGDRWANLILSAEIAPGKNVSVNLATKAGRQTATIVSNDAGALLKRLDVVDGVEGGRLNLVGTRQVGETNGPWKGRAKVQDFRLMRAPVLARLLTLASLTGARNVLSGGKGIDFRSLEVPYTLKDGRLLVENARSMGSELGLTADGALDFGADSIDLRGTIVPAYTLNSLLGHIPLLGRIFTGKKGSGVFAVSYAVKGSVEKPEASANPLSVLTPGFLRNLSDVVLEGKADNRSPVDGLQEQ